MRGRGNALTRLSNVPLRRAELLAKQRFELWSHFLKVHEREEQEKWKRGINYGSKVQMQSKLIN